MLVFDGVMETKTSAYEAISRGGAPRPVIDNNAQVKAGERSLMRRRKAFMLAQGRC
jgi:hypothetical protein